MQTFLGFLVSTLGGAIVISLVVDFIGWGYLEACGVGKKPKGSLSTVLGICERTSYTTAILLAAPNWIGVWLAIKVAVHWNQWKTDNRGVFNLFLIGNLLSIGFGLLGAWIANGRTPLLQ